MGLFHKAPPSQSVDLNFSKLHTNERDQKICEGCLGILRLFRKKREHQSNLTCRFHRNYQELDRCAKNGCTACRVFRKALLLPQITWDGVKGLEISNDGEVWASLKEDYGLQVTIRNQSDGEQQITAAAAVACTERNNTGHVDLNLKLGASQSREELKSWLTQCDRDHDCINYGWSDENPSRLVRIFDRFGQLEIVDGSSMQYQKYAALSYQWGTELASDDDEKTAIRGIKALKKVNGRFHISDLQVALQNAVKLMVSLEIHYIWIDALCIPSENWNHEASRMHVVYGNAYVTLSVCSSRKTTQCLDNMREAWRYPSRPCTLDRYWLSNYDTSLDEIRSQAPLFSRGWTLQEERLSPRIIYLSSQRAYWSCSRAQRMEMGQVTPRSRLDGPFEDPSRTKTWRPPQEFLATRYNQDKENLHRQWLEMVRDFIRRDMFDAGDRFPAMSGLAAQYLVVFKRGDRVHGQEYLAGLWRQTFAQDLAWSVERAADVDESKPAIAATWSWASLPLCTPINVAYNFDACEGEEFQLLEESRSGLKDKKDVLQIALIGAETRTVKIKGPLRSLTSSLSRAVPWSEIMPKSRHSEECEDFDFSRHRSSFIHAVEPVSGKIVAKEPNKRPVIGQLDYRLPQSPADNGWIRSLTCLQIGASTMLLLARRAESIQATPDTVSLWCYSRVGLARDVHPTFFNSAFGTILTLGEEYEGETGVASY
jgi:Heterokaryon incompatibility protein (HET)